MVAHSDWQALKVELRKEARSRFYSMGDVVLIELNNKSDLELTLTRRAATLKVTFLPERHEVRWKMDKESGLEPVSEPIARLAETLVKQLMSPGPIPKE
jgi:hypothetical protein